MFNSDCNKHVKVAKSDFLCCCSYQYNNEPGHEIVVLFAHRKRILQARMRSHPVELGIWCLIFGRTHRLLPYFMCTNSEGSGETAWIRRLAWAFAGRLCNKYNNLMSWLICQLVMLLRLVKSCVLALHGGYDPHFILALTIIVLFLSWDLFFVNICKS